jgi:hypothetical protein
MLATYPTFAERLSPILLFERPYVSDDDQPTNTTPNQMVARESFFRKMRQLRGETAISSQSVYQMRQQAKDKIEASPGNAPFPITGRVSNEILSKTGLSLSQSIDLQKPEVYDSLLSNTANPAYIAPVLAEQLSLFLEHELIALYDDARLGQAERVLEYLAKAESGELDPWAQDDIRVSWLTVLYAARGFERPWHYAFYSYYGKTFEKALPIWLERWAARDAVLGPGLAEGEAVYPAKKKPTSIKFSQDSQVPGRNQKKESL